ncbi:MAG: class I SAM-dependent methyltransferase [Actinomycetota bacterium]
MGRERLEIEFGRYSEWLAEAIAELGIDPIPASCRGTGNPALFERMADGIRADSKTRVLDLGCGLGGPGAWLAGSRGCRVVGVDVMEAGVRGLKRLFPDACAVVASLRSLPFPDGNFDGAWALGVIETITDKATALDEVARVLVPDGRFAVFSFVASQPMLFDVPIADRFEQPEVVLATLASAGFTTIAAGPVAGLPQPPTEWTDPSDKARAEVHRRHRGDPKLDDVDAEIAKIRKLVRSKEIEAWQFVLEKEGSR